MLTTESQDKPQRSREERRGEGRRENREEKTDVVGAKTKGDSGEEPHRQLYMQTSWGKATSIYLPYPARLLSLPPREIREAT
jgi:hypothetical protein